MSDAVVIAFFIGGTVALALDRWLRWLDEKTAVFLLKREDGKYVRMTKEFGRYEWVDDWHDADSFGSRSMASGYRKFVFKYHGTPVSIVIKRPADS